jgi:hypothetical protein
MLSWIRKLFFIKHQNRGNPFLGKNIHSDEVAKKILNLLPVRD